MSSSASRIVVGMTASPSNLADVQVTPTSSSKVASWILGAAANLDDVSRELSEFQVKLVELSSLLQGKHTAAQLDVLIVSVSAQ